MRLVDYVVAHEVVHVMHRDHTKAFWARLGVLPTMWFWRDPANWLLVRVRSCSC